MHCSSSGAQGIRNQELLCPYNKRHLSQEADNYRSVGEGQNEQGRHCNSTNYCTWLWRVRFELYWVISERWVEQTWDVTRLPQFHGLTRAVLPALEHVLEVAQVQPWWLFSGPALQEFSLGLPEELGRWGKKERLCLVASFLPALQGLVP